MNGPGVYCITQISTGRRYVGSSVDMKTRKSTHLTGLKGGYHHNYFLQNAWNKYGPVDFCFSILEQCANRDATVEREQFWIDSLRPEFNLSQLAHSPGGYTLTKEDKRRLGASLSATYSTTEGREKQRVRAAGRWDTEEKRKKYSEINSAAQNRPEVKAATGARSREYWKNPEYRARVMAGRLKDAESRRGIRPPWMNDPVKLAAAKVKISQKRSEKLKDPVFRAHAAAMMHPSNRKKRATAMHTETEY